MTIADLAVCCVASVVVSAITAASPPRLRVTVCVVAVPLMLGAVTVYATVA